MPARRTNRRLSPKFLTCMPGAFRLALNRPPFEAANSTETITYVTGNPVP